MLIAYFTFQILTIFIKDNPVAMEFGRQRYIITFPIYFLAGIMSVLPGAIRGLGSSVPPSIISLVGACGVRIVWVYTVFKMYPNLSVLYLVHPITWIITIVALSINLRLRYKKVKRGLEETEVKIYIPKRRRQSA